MAADVGRNLVNFQLSFCEHVCTGRYFSLILLNNNYNKYKHFNARLIGNFLGEIYASLEVFLSESGLWLVWQLYVWLTSPPLLKLFQSKGPSGAAAYTVAETL